MVLGKMRGGKRGKGGKPKESRIRNHKAGCTDASFQTNGWAVSEIRNGDMTVKTSPRTHLRKRRRKIKCDIDAELNIPVE